MRIEHTRTFQKSCLALAILSLSACATTDSPSDMDRGSLYERVGAAGKRSMEMGSNAWQHTREALGLNNQTPDSLLDEVDLALMEEDAVMPGSRVRQQARQRAVTGNPTRRASNSAEPVLAAAKGPSRSTGKPAAEGGDEREVTIVAANYDDSATSDYLHEVTSSDTLWSIARTLTGDPGNWQQLAKLNDLSPDASVQAGQQLRIPRELLSGSAADEAASVTAATSATRTQDKPAVAAPDTQKVVARKGESRSFTVQDSETLWDLAKRATGDATLWKAIAEYNALSEQQIKLVQAGQTVLVPARLIKKRDASGAKRETVQSDTTAAAVPTATEPTSDDAPAAAIPTAPQAAATPTTTAPTAADVTTMDDISEEQEVELESIMVSGTYYPKAIYNKADFSSSLLMRVSPGTALKVAGAEGPWYQVETDKGIGYMHARDIR